MLAMKTKAATTTPTIEGRGFRFDSHRWILVFVYVAVYCRTLRWGWLGMDDTKILHQNPFIGPTWAGLKFAFTDVTFGRRWMPGLWLVADLVPNGSVFGYRLLSFTLGMVVCLLVHEFLRRSLRAWLVLPLSLLFALSPTRLEVFGWSVGFVYEATLLWLLLAVFMRHRRWIAGFFLLMAVLTYPQAAGGCLLFAWAWRRSWWGIGIVAGLAVLFYFQMRIRIAIGVGTFNPQFEWIPMSIAHYFLTMLWPFATVSIFPVGWYSALLVGYLFAAIWLAISWRSFVVLMIVFAPTLLASVTEPYAFAARYSLIFAVVFWWGAGRWLDRAKVAWRRPIRLSLYALIAVFCLMNLGDLGMRSRRDCVLQLQWEGKLVGLTFVPGNMQEIWGPKGPPEP